MKGLARIGQFAGLVSVVLAGLVACGAPPRPPLADLAYALIIENGVATVRGTAFAPRVEPGSPPMLTRSPVANAIADLVDASGTPIAAVPPTRTDDRGRYFLYGPRIGEPAYVRVRYEEAGTTKTMYAFLRPESETLCARVDLATTVLARGIARSPTLPDAFESEKLPAVLAQIEAELPASLAAEAARTGKEPRALLEELLTGGGGPSPPAGATRSGTIADLVLDAPAVAGAIAVSERAWLDVTFSIKAIGANRAAYPGVRAVRHLMRGDVRLVCSLAASAADYAQVSFWLNNDRAADAVYDGTTQSWRARVDTRAWPDGPYVLAAMATPYRETAPVSVSKAFVFVDNRIKEVGSCDE